MPDVRISLGVPTAQAFRSSSGTPLVLNLANSCLYAWIGGAVVRIGEIVPSAKFGDVAGGDYAEFQTDGSLLFYGDATTFRDELGDITNIKVLGTGITENTAENTLDFLTSCDPATDYAYANFQLNHDRLLASKVFPHVHWFQEQNTGVNFLIQYRWQRNGAAKTTAWTNLALTTGAFTYTSGTLNQITGSAAGITPPASDGISDILQIRLTRDKTNTTGAFTGADTYSVSAMVTSLDLHLEVDSLGSRQEYVK